MSCSSAFVIPARATNIPLVRGRGGASLRFGISVVGRNRFRGETGSGTRREPAGRPAVQLCEAATEIFSTQY
jgi:hypothetical protein